MFESKGDLEHSRRNYLLIADPGEITERAIEVTSSCTKSRATEAQYGSCVHAIKAANKKPVIINTGEDVVVVDRTGDGPFIATIEYGCCASLDTVRFYDETARFLGALDVRDAERYANGQNLLTRRFDFRNVARKDERQYWLFRDEKSPMDQFRFTVLRVEKGKPYEFIRFSVQDVSPPDSECDTWILSGFDAFADRSDITLKLLGTFCESKGQVFSCRDVNSSFACTTLPATR